MNRVQTKPPPPWWPKPVTDPSIDEIFDSIFLVMRADLKALTRPETERNPVAVARGLNTLRATYRALISQGHTEYQPMLDDLQVGLDGFAQEVRAMLAKALDDPRTSVEDAEMIREYFAEDQR
jgi:hypothetical protein